MKGLSGAVAVSTAMVVCCCLLVSGCDRNPPDGEYVLTGTNAQGFKEYLCLRDSSIMVRIPKGTFIMGDTVNSDEMPVHSVYLGEYLIDKCEITNKQYKWFCDSTGTAYPNDPHFSGMDDYFLSFPDHPVVEVSWLDAAAYAAWAHKSIATEAQWEKAGRGTDARRYPWGNLEPDSTLCNMGDGDTFGYTSPVGQFAAGASFYGCMDLAGNVWEWCSDWYNSDYYAVSPGSNPTGPDSGYDRVAKGGSYNNGQSVWVRCAERYWGPESGGNHPALGFRCAVVW
jgi:sulfatase modifying factor 1